MGFFFQDFSVQCRTKLKNRRKTYVRHPVFRSKLLVLLACRVSLGSSSPPKPVYLYKRHLKQWPSNSNAPGHCQFCSVIFVSFLLQLCLIPSLTLTLSLFLCFTGMCKTPHALLWCSLCGAWFELARPVHSRFWVIMGGDQKGKMADENFLLHIVIVMSENIELDYIPITTLNKMWAKWHRYKRITGREVTPIQAISCSLSDRT